MLWLIHCGLIYLLFQTYKMKTKKDQINIKRLDFESVSGSLFKELRRNGDFFDMTLACDDAQFRAHKALLAACSKDFFLKILRHNPHEYPYIYLKGVKSDILLSVLNFLYNGEVELSIQHSKTC